MRTERKIIIIAGPNGAGKTTFAQEFLPREAACTVFINADLIAVGLSPFAPGAADIRAGRLMLKEIALHIRRHESFAFETTLSGRRYTRMIPEWQQMGYDIKLVFLYLPDVAVGIERVRARVKQGGHNVPENIIRSRYDSGWRNFQEVYKHLVDSWVVYDNSGAIPVLVDTGGKE
jgi:predicted ABC-type ATPase